MRTFPLRVHHHGRRPHLSGHHDHHHGHHPLLLPMKPRIHPKTEIHRHSYRSTVEPSQELSLLHRHHDHHGRLPHLSGHRGHHHGRLPHLSGRRGHRGHHHGHRTWYPK